MNFKHLKLLVAIELFGEHGRDRLTTEKRLAYAAEIRRIYSRITGDVFFPYSADDVNSFGVRFRKDKKNIQPLAVVASMYKHCNCFWDGRGVGECCEDAVAGRIYPEANETEINPRTAILECKTHNKDRGDRTVVEYLALKLGIEKALPEAAAEDKAAQARNEPDPVLQLMLNKV